MVRAKGKGRRRAPRARVFYLDGTRLRPADLIYEEDQPVLVLRWHAGAHGRSPAVSFHLDHALLRPVPHREGEFLYRGPLLRKKARG